MSTKDNLTLVLDALAETLSTLKKYPNSYSMTDGWVDLHRVERHLPLDLRNRQLLRLLDVLADQGYVEIASSTSYVVREARRQLGFTAIDRTVWMVRFAL